jgi:hypothetical protein
MITKSSATVLGTEAARLQAEADSIAAMSGPSLYRVVFGRDPDHEVAWRRDRIAEFERAHGGGEEFERARLEYRWLHSLPTT